jgi:hypothetical protein
MEIKHLLILIVGFLIGGIVMCFYMYDKYNKKEQKRKIARFIREMKRLKKAGKTVSVEKAVKIFSERCLNFDQKSFRALKRTEFDTIANILLAYDNASFAYPNNQDYGIENNRAQMIEATTSREKIKNLIEELLKKIIYA